MKLRAENGAGLVDDAFITRIVEVDEVFLPILWQSRYIHRISMVLARDVAFTCCEIQSRDVVCTISVLEFDSPRASCQSNQLVSQANTHYWDLRRVHQLPEVVDCFLAMRRVARTIADEDTVEMMGHFMDWVVVGECGDACATANKASQDV